MKNFKITVAILLSIALSTLMLLSTNVQATPVLPGDLEYETFGLDHNASLSDNAFFEMTAENAGFAANTSFGVYEVGNITNRVTVFDGSDTTGAKSKLQWNTNTNDVALTTFNGMSWTTLATVGNINAYNFGFFLNVGDIGKTWYSETALNSDGIDHMATYFGGTLNSFMLGWEDLNGGGDKDYNDMVVYVDDIVPAVSTTTVTQVSEPTALMLMGLGLLGLAGVNRKYK